ncbi:MAG: hypothetical protein PF569_08755 [Candidatus Woesearchaeota archaeon]|jgi:hypothetical protein|nr:hypothetical protein [Candidatus Woesearchaeota archaeon]
MFDFDSIRQRIIENLAEEEEHKDIFESGAYSSLVDSLAQELEFYHTASGYRTRENQWGLSLNKSSLLSQSEVHNYSPSRIVSATGFVKFGVSEDFDTTPTTIINIPKYTQFSNDSGISFVSVNDYQMSTLDTSIDIAVKQGVYQSLTVNADGDIFETIAINSSNIEEDSVVVYVNDLLYEQIDNLLDYGPNDLICFIINKIDLSGIRIQFGNNIIGKKLNSNDRVVIQYINSIGTDGNINSKNVVKNVDSIIYDVSANIVEDVFCTNDLAIIGGADESTLEEIRLQSPKVYQTGDRAITKDDYISILERLSYVKKANVWGAYEYNIDNGLNPWTYILPEENVTHVAIVTETNENLTDAQKLQILEDINVKKSPTNLLNFETVEFINLNFVVSAYIVNASYSLPSVKSAIEAGLQEKYSIDNIAFEENLYESDYKRYIDAIPGVKYHDTYIELYKEYDFYSPYVFDVDLPIYPLKPATFKVYVKLKTEGVESYVLMGTGNGTGGFTPEAGYSLTDSLISLSTGQGAIIINSGLTEDYTLYDVKLVYQSVNSNIILNNRRDLFLYGSSEITVQYYQS